MPFGVTIRQTIYKSTRRLNMATFNESSPSVTGGTKPASIGGIGGSTTWGIDNALDNCIVQSEQITDEDITDQTQDQKGAVVNNLTYDRHKTLNLTFLTDQALSAVVQSGQTDFTYGGYKWFVNNVTYNGSYNGKKQYSISAERWVNYPSNS